jgi:ribonuclease P protein component
MTPRSRLVSSSDFRRVLKTGRSVARPEIVLYYATGVLGGPRFGFIVGRKIGGAVSRNRVKRLLRESCRTLADRLQEPVDIIVLAREPILNMRLPDLREAVAACALRAGLMTAV